MRIVNVAEELNTSDMTTSDWISIGTSLGGTLITMLGMSWVISFKLGAIHQEIKSLSDRVSRLEKQMHKVLKVLTSHHYRIKRLEKITAKLHHDFYKR